ncbi:DUF2066 domain-containing protein [Ectothiorhodospiraceae bacterium BW-2]|nr:DUF2066 domain-containing protein [Ectothiorhodospiraceae bacterium BW-2]
MFRPTDHRYYVLLLTLLVLMPCQLQAVNMPELYQSAIYVATQSEQERQAALKQALQQVLQRMTGLRTLPNSDLLNSELLRASTYVQQYSYRSRLGGGTELWVEFDPITIERLIRTTGLPYWGVTRPLIMIWLVVGESGQLTLVDRFDTGLAKELLTDTATERGLPVVLPNLTDSNTRAISVATIQRTIDSRMEQIAANEGAQLILQGYLRPVGEQWQINLQLQQEGHNSERWQSRASSPSALIGHTIHQLADRLGRQLAFRLGGESESLRLQVSGVAQFEHYVRIFNYLQQLNAVKQLSLEQISGDTLQFMLTPKGDRRNIEQLIDLGELLTVDSNYPPPLYGDERSVELPSADLNYRLR